MRVGGGWGECDPEYDKRINALKKLKVDRVRKSHSFELEKYAGNNK